MKKDALLKKYKGKITTKKEDGLIRESDFKEIVVTDEYSAKRLQNVITKCTIRKPDEKGEMVSIVDNKLYQSMLVLETCEFDGKKLTRVEVEKLESSFLSDLFNLASPDEEKTPTTQPDESDE